MHRSVGLAISVDLDVDLVQVRDGVGLELLLAAVTLESNGQDTCAGPSATSSSSAHTVHSPNCLPQSPR